MKYIKQLRLYGRSMLLPYGGGLIIAFIIALIPTYAQDNVISDNQVNAVAEKMYCPVCENIPLDECQTTTCVEWKEEIRAQLASGETSEEIIDSFVTRFGDHVVGTPQDPILRALTIIMPIIGALLAIIVGVFTFRRFGSNQKLTLENEIIGDPHDDSDEAYRQRLEQDLHARR